MTTETPLITVAVPSYNQGCFLEKALSSLLDQHHPIEIFVMDAGSTDNSLDIIHRFEHHLAGWRSHADKGQAAAINEGISKGNAPYVCWLNSDDWLLPDGLTPLIEALEKHPKAPAAYGRAWNVHEATQTRQPVWVEPFNVQRLAYRSIISQPATLIRRTAWEGIHGLNDTLHMAMDYDLWWRLYRAFGSLQFVESFIAVNREHDETKTNTQRRAHYQEAIQTVRTHYGRVPLKWYLYQPYAVWYKSLKNRFSRR